jgi:uncharacterized protein with HEPN domain
MNPSVLKRLHDALESARYIVQFLAGTDFASYQSNAMLRSAVERQLEIAGEALGRSRVEFPDLESQVPDLSKIIGLRNRLAHGYGEIDHEIIWSIGVEEVPGLIVRLERILSDMSPAP